MNAVSPIVFFVLLLSVTSLAKPQNAACSLCQQIIDTISDQITGDLTETKVQNAIELMCTSFALESWCQKHLFPQMNDVFLALRSEETPKTICERINLCHFKIMSITGDILFTERDRIDIIVPSVNVITRYEWGRITHPEINVMNITGLACAPDYCAVLLQGVDKSGIYRYGVTALSAPSYQIRQVHHELAQGLWFGPWYDIHTNQFWLATGYARNITFGIFDAQYGDFIPKITFHIHFRPGAKILSGMILNRVLYFTLFNDNHVFYLDVATFFYRGNFTTPPNTMLVGNPVTDELYGYSKGKEGVFRFDQNFRKITQIVNIDLTNILPVPSSTFNPIDNTMWLSLWGGPVEAFMKVDLKKTTENVMWAAVDNLEGYFDFNPFEVKTVEI